MALRRIATALLAAGLIVGLIQTVCMALLPFDYVYLVLYLLLAAILILRREGLSRAARRAPRLAGVLGLSDPAGTQECRRRRSCVGLLVDRSCRPYPVWGGVCFLELRFSSPRWSTSSSIPTSVGRWLPFVRMRMRQRS